tara:strand:- start:1775 stop:2029 length:255 start_codon:yes stop_codon:yes gene_type:complete
MSHDTFDHRHYVIIPYSEANNIDFDQVMESDIDTVRVSVDGMNTFVKYEHEMPSSVVAIQDKSQEYSHREILQILSTEEWTPSA